MTEYREVEFISADWMDRAAWWPGLQVHSRPIQVPILDHPLRRKTDEVFVASTTSADVIERLLREAFLLPLPLQAPEPFQSIELENIQSTHGNAVAQLAER